ncbi:hypothetical protein FSP39_009218 [Pinctada imbricata]|uniref:Uncharacterized protein n=1 Tax=Pinctada imbricata TaxID=66713 RepID=A0AA89BWM0_PINIB|nr:hypothetical protein FSP39_009218 [Pinctada imbricata]
MDDTEIKVFYQFFGTLCTDVNSTSFAFKLLGRGLISAKTCESVVCSSQPRESNNVVLLRDVSKTSKMDDFLGCLHEAGHGSTADDMTKEIQKMRTQLLVTPHRVSMTYRDDVMDRFAERLKMKIHNAEASRCASDFRSWISRFLGTLSDPDLDPREEKRLADFCFVLLDTLIVLERTHSESKEHLFQRKEFSDMKELIVKTSNPTLMRIRYNGRYGMALAQSGQEEKALEKLQSSLDDAQRYSPGKDIGNCLFAIVNVKMLMYSIDKSERMKQEILSFIEEAIRFFENEEENALLNWRRIYLIKKAYCYLGLDSFGRDILGVTISDYDLEMAGDCLNMFEKIESSSDIRRKMHLFRARAKLHTIKEEKCIADGYVKQALALAQEGKFLADIQVLENCIHQEQHSKQDVHSRARFQFSERIRQPSEHDETSYGVTMPSLTSLLGDDDNDTVCECSDVQDVQTPYLRINLHQQFSPELESPDTTSFVWEQCKPEDLNLETSESDSSENTDRQMEQSMYRHIRNKTLLNTAVNSICGLLQMEVIPINYPT